MARRHGALGLSSQPHRQSLERIRGVLEKVHQVLRHLNERRGEPAQAGDNADLLRPHEAARRLEMPIRDVYAAARDRRLPSTRIGRFLWFRRNDVDAFAATLRPSPSSVRRGAGARGRAATKRQMR